MIKSYLYTFGAGAVLLLFTSHGAQADPTGPNLFPSGTFDNVVETYNPWAGVDGDGYIHGIPGQQNAVGDDGGLYGGIFGPSAAVGDLNGDGKPDLVLADARGYIWWFPNSGTLTEPKFTQGQIMPVWLGEKKIDGRGEGTDNIVPRIQLVDFLGDKKLGLAVGTYAGKLFYVQNRGSTAQPNFPVTMDISRYAINTHKKGVLWLNYLSPCLYPWFNSHILDLVTGEGSYSANSIYLIKNMNSSLDPTFNEDNLQKIAPGMGLEQLTPAIIDWNNDGKPDILAGDRTGDINLFLNTSPDETHITFGPAKQLSIGGMTKFGGFTTVAVADLTGNKLPNLLIGSDAGTVLYATNTGKLGAPDFSTAPVALKGVNPFPKITVPTDWVRTQPAGVPDELVTVVNPKLEKGFIFPAGETTAYAMKFLLFPITDPTFPKRYYPDPEDDYVQHNISCLAGTQPLKMKTKYLVHCWAKADSSIEDSRIAMSAQYWAGSDGRALGEQIPLSPGTEWTEVSKDIEFRPEDAPKDLALGFVVAIQFKGQGSLYVDDITIKEDK